MDSYSRFFLYPEEEDSGWFKVYWGHYTWKMDAANQMMKISWVGGVGGSTWLVLGRLYSNSHLKKLGETPYQTKPFKPFRIFPHRFRGEKNFLNGFPAPAQYETFHLHLHNLP